MCSIVQLSVGGTRFEAPRATLCRVPGSFFDLLLGGDGDDGGARGGGGSFAAPADGVYRVNRAPTAFPLVLEYLRSGLGDMSWPDAAWQSQEMISAVGPPSAYGGDPDGATWDEDKVQGCVCDSAWPVGYGAGQRQMPQWAGADCSLQRCPSGDDPRTPDMNEQDCAFFDDNGATWRGVVGSDGALYAPGAALPPGVTVAQAATAEPGVNSGAPGNLCYVACSRRGNCDLATGICTCFQGYYGPACSFKSAQG